jgi:hypothetical protein
VQGPLSRWGEIYNYVEIGLWAGIGAVVGALAVRGTGASRRHGLLAAFTLVAFGLSDWAEIKTGGEWWRPWWLLAWKAACVLVLLTLGVLAYRRKPRP